MDTDPKARPNPIPIARLREEFLAVSASGGQSRAGLRQAEFVVEALMKMGLASTDDLIIGPDLVVRFLDAWGRSTRRPSIVEALNLLGRVCTFAFVRGYLGPASFDGRRIPVPPSWDQADPAFAQAGRDLPSRRGFGRGRSTSYTGPQPSWEEVARLVGHLRAGSRTWKGARIFALVSAVVLARLRLTEALKLPAGDVRPEERTITVASREGSRPGTTVWIGPQLAEILSRWLERAGPGWTFPNETRGGPWAALTARNQKAATILAGACRAAGVPPFTLLALRKFGLDAVARLAIAGESPFELGPDDLRLNPVPIADLESAVLATYGPKQRTCRRMAGVVLDVIEGMGLGDSSALGSPRFVDRFIEAAAIADPESASGRHTVIWLHTVCGKAIWLGHLDDDPFAGRPGFVNKARLRGPDRPVKSPRRYRRRSNVVEMLSPPPSAPAADPEASGKGQRPDPIPWRGTREELDREIDAIESEATRDVVRKLIELMPVRPTKIALERASGRGDAVNLLKGFAILGSRLGRAVGLPGKGGRGYWIEIIVPENP